MVAYHYDFRIALVKGSPNAVAANATVLVYDPLDTGMTTPVAVYSNPGMTTIINLVTDAHGVVPDFWSERPDLLWKSGTYSGGWATTSSRPGLRGPAGGVGPAGPTGPQGAPGLNGAGTNAEVAAFIPSSGPTRDALDARYTPTTGLPDFIGANLPARLGESALNATYAPPTSALQDVLGRLRTGVQDVSILVLSDSTAAMTDSWVKQLPAALAAQFPGYKVSLKEWVDGSPGSWGSATITGAGIRTINLWNGSVAGMTWDYHMDATRREAMISTPAPDVVMYSLGHNDNYSLAQVNNLGSIRDKASTYIEVMRTIVPTAAVVLLSQNPLLGTDRNLATQFRADLYRRMALERGYGFIDICQAFIDDAQPLTTLVSGDLVHPAAAGFTVWVNEVMRHFKTQANSQVIPLQLPSFHTASKNYVRNPAFDSFSPPAAPQDWFLTNVTVSKDTARYETGGWSVQMGKSGAGLSSIAISIFPTTQLAGQWLTFAARVYIPAGNPASSAQVAIHSNTINAVSDQWGVFDQWFWRTVTVRIPVGENSISVEVINDQTGAATGTSLVDRVTCIIGRYPVDLF